MGKTLTGKQREKLIKQFGHVPTKEEIFQKIKESQERLVSSLAGMWQTAPDDPKVKGKILEAMEKAMKLRQNVYKTVLKEEPPEIRPPEKLLENMKIKKH